MYILYYYNSHSESHYHNSSFTKFKRQYDYRKSCDTTQPENLIFIIFTIVLTFSTANYFTKMLNCISLINYSMYHESNILSFCLVFL